MKQPKHWNELTEQEKKDYRQRQWSLIAVRWVCIIIILFFIIQFFSNLEEFKNYLEPLSYTLNKYPELSCTYQGNKVELVDGKAVIKKQLDSFGKQYQFQEIDFGGLNLT